MNFTSGKSGIWPLAAPENQGFVKLRKFPRGKDLGTRCFCIYSIWEEAGRCLVCWGKDGLVVTSTNSECEARRTSDLKKDELVVMSTISECEARRIGI
jgi:hypothetical protein